MVKLQAIKQCLQKRGLDPTGDRETCAKRLREAMKMDYGPKFLGSVFKIEPSKPKEESKTDEGQLTQTSGDVHDQPFQASTSGSQTVSISNQDQISRKEIEGSIDEVFQCPECEEPFSTLDTLKLHFKKSHKLTSKQLGASNLDTYQSKPLKAKSPVKLSIPEVSNEDKHQTHNLDKVHQAPDDKPSKSKVEVVTEVKQVKSKVRCEICNKTFSALKNQREHQRNIHESIGKVIQCKAPGCDKKFAVLKHMNQHFKRHK